jgi:hypothetical protein
MRRVVEDKTQLTGHYFRCNQKGGSVSHKYVSKSDPSNLYLSVAWAGNATTQEHILLVMNQIRPVLSTRQIFDENTEYDDHQYHLKSIIIKTGSHEYALARVGDRWVEINDNRIAKPVQWKDVVTKCVNQRGCPLLIHYGS